MTVVAWVGGGHRAARGHRRDRAARHQTGARVLDDQPARLHVPRRRHRRVQRRRVHGDLPRVLQGLPLPRRRLGDPRQRRQPGHADHGPVPQVPALHRGRDAWSRGSRSPACRRSRASWSKDEIISQAFLRDDYGALDRRARRRRVHRRLHDPADLPDVLRQRALRDAPGRLPGAAPTRRAGARRRRRRRAPTAIRRRRSRTATRSPAPSDAPDRTSARAHGRCPSLVLAVLAVVGGLLNLPFDNLEFLTEWLEPCSDGVPRSTRRRSSRVSRSSAGGRHRARRHRARLHALPPGLAARRATTRSPSARAVARCSATPTTTTTASAGSSTGPAARLRRGSTGSSTPRSSTARSTASAGSCGSLAAASRKLQDGLVRRYALGDRARHGRRCSLYFVLWRGR